MLQTSGLVRRTFSFEFSFSEFPKGIHLTLFDNNKNKTVITADYGVVYNVTNLIDLQGNVVIARHTNDTIFAKQLYYKFIINNPFSFIILVYVKLIAIFILSNFCESRSC